MHVPHGEAKDGHSWCTITYATYQNSSPINIENIPNTNLQVSSYDILVSWILCDMYLYAHKSRLKARDA